MRIAILVKEFPPDVIGGTETQTKRLARTLEEYSNHDVTVVTKSYPGTEDISTEYELVRVPTWHITPVISTLTYTLGAFLLLLRQHREFDLVQCMMIYPNGFVGYLVSLLTGLPYFAWIRGGDYYFMKQHRIKRFTIRRVLEDTLVLVQADRIRSDVLREFPQANLRVLENGVDIPEETADGDAVVFVGRLEDQKGVDVLLEAMDGMDEQLLVIGDGSQRNHLEHVAGQLEVNVEFVGKVSPENVETYLRRGKVFVLPSVRGEGLPNAMLEAMAVGLPVVVTDTAGVADSVCNGETGYVVPPGDVETLRERLQRLCSNRARCRKMGQQAREYVRTNHSWQSLVEELNSVYTDVASEPAP